MSTLPTTNGRDANGRFVKGNPGGPGNPYAKRVARFRQILMEAVTEQDLYDLARKLVEKGKEGDVMATREVLDRLMGKPEGTSEMLQIENEMQRILTLLVLWEKEQKKQLAKKQNKRLPVERSEVDIFG